MTADDLSRHQRLIILTGAGVLLSLAMGMRQSFGLFQPHMVRDLGFTTADFSLAISLQNIIWGITQPFVGAIADRFGTRYVVLAGVALFIAGLVLMLQAHSVLILILGTGVCIGLSLSCVASSMAMMISSRAVSAAKRSVTMGIISAVGSFGLVLASPLAQTLIVNSGWQVALIGFIGLAVVMIPAAIGAGRIDKVEISRAEQQNQTLTQVLQSAFGHSGYVAMACAFFVCGLQLVFITTHLPNYLAICGMDPSLSATALSTIGFFNMIGSYVIGLLGGYFPKQRLLGLVYILRSLAIAAYFMTPATPVSTVVFAAIMGSLWLGVVPLVNGLVAQLFGLRFMATLTGIAFMSHQAGSFLGAWGAGLIFDKLGSYDRAWQFSVVIGLIAGTFQIMMNVRPPKPRDLGTPVLNPA